MEIVNKDISTELEKVFIDNSVLAAVERRIKEEKLKIYIIISTSTNSRGSVEVTIRLSYIKGVDIVNHISMTLTFGKVEVTEGWYFDGTSKAIENLIQAFSDNIRW